MLRRQSIGFWFSLMLAACGGSSNGGGSPTPTASPTSTPIATATPAGDVLTGALPGLSLGEPAIGTLFACNLSELAPSTQPWTDNETGEIFLDESPRVPGDVLWESELEIETDDSVLVVVGNSLPSHPTGIFPVPEDSEAYEYDPNPNHIAALDIDWELPATPEIADEPTCVGTGPIGIMLTGAVLYHSVDLTANVAAGERVLDDCLGHPGIESQYHYHTDSPCFDTGSEDEHSPLLGYVLDGFGFYGPRDEGGELITNAELDECHGHVGPVPSGETVYHYHANDEFPFTVGCYKGTPANVQFPLHAPHVTVRR